MKVLALLLKLLGCLALAFFGYFVMAAVGWPGDLDSMVMERRFVGGAFVLLGGLCALAVLVPERPKPKPARRVQPDFGPEPDLPDLAPAPEPAPAALPAPPQTLALPAPTPEPPEATQLEPEPEPAASEAPDPAPAAPAAHPASLAAARDLLGAGDRLYADGRLEDAQEPYAQALEAARALHQSAPGSDTQDLLACALKAVGDVHDEMGRHDPAVEHYEQALRLRTVQLSDAPDDPLRKRAVSLILERLGDVRDARGHITRALDLYRQSLPIAQSLAAAEPGNPVYQEDLATTERRIAELQTRPPI